MIRNIIFRGDISVSIGLREYGDINSWVGHKHAKHIDAEVKDGWVRLYPKVEGKRTGIVKELPLSSIAYIDREYEIASKK